LSNCLKPLPTLFQRRGRLTIKAPLGELDGTSTFVLNRIAELRNEKRYSTAANYQRTLNSFSSFAESENICGGITLSMITDSLIGRYEAWLKSRGVKRNTTSFYMCILRAVYNLAVKQGLGRQLILSTRCTLGLT